MSLRNYLVKSDGPAVEIRWDFLQVEIEQLYNLLKEKGFDQYRTFVREHLADILKYISLSPSQRKQKKWANHPNNLLIRFAALQISEATVRMLRDLEPAAHIVDGGSYRSFHSVFADAIGGFLLQYPLVYFPFEDYDNPFLKND